MRLVIQPYFYYARKYWYDSQKIYIWKFHYNSTNFQTPVTSNGGTWGSSSGYGRTSIVTTNSSGTSIDHGGMGSKDDTALHLAYQEDGIGRLFYQDDGKLWSVSFDLQDDDDYKDTDAVTMISGTYNQFGAMDTGSTENDKNHLVAYAYSGYWFVMNTWYNSANSNANQGRIYYDVVPLTRGYSSASTSALSNYFSGMYSRNHQGEPLLTYWNPIKNEIAWVRTSRNFDWNSNGTQTKQNYSGIWGGVTNNIANKFIGVASASASANASVDIDMPYVETANQSGLTTGDTVQFLRTSGAISSTSSAVNTLTHKEIGIATSASTFLIRDK